jgi:hypothetical protein
MSCAPEYARSDECPCAHAWTIESVLEKTGSAVELVSELDVMVVLGPENVDDKAVLDAGTETETVDLYDVVEDDAVTD